MNCIFKILLVFSFANFKVLYANIKTNDDISEGYKEFFNFGDKKLSKLNRSNLENAIIKSKVEVLGQVFKKNIDAIKTHRELDLILLVDGSSSVGEINFKSELKFVKKLLSDVTVDYNHTRVSVISFSAPENVIIHVDEISNPNEDNNKCLLLNKQLNEITYSGGGTFTLGAFKVAKQIFANSRNSSRKALFLITDGFSNGGDPVPTAKELKQNQVTIFTIGIQNGNYKELYELSSEPGEHYSYLLDSFEEFENLARRALHTDLHTGDYISLTSRFCDNLCNGTDCCDQNALCVCGTSTGHYSCLCQPGFYGTGLKNSCEPCPDGTFSQGPNVCLPCPDINHFTVAPAIGLSSCQCKKGFKSVDGTRCEVLKCPKLTAPEYGHFVMNKKCGNVLFTACGIRCDVGYTLTGSSIRLCQENGTWSGDEPSCQVKTCETLPPPQFGSVTCSHTDLGITYNSSETKFPVDTTCTFSCEKGRILTGSKQRTCLPLARWDGLRTNCKQIKCSRLSQIQHGKILPGSCIKEKQMFGSNCTFVCNKGYENVGPEVVSCFGKHGSWKPQPEYPACIDKTPPEIECPANIIGTTLPGKKYGTVNWTEPTATDNSGLNISVWSKPAIKSITDFEFNIGPTWITYFAQDAFKNRVKCKFVVNIQDEEPPTIEDCEDPPPYLADDKIGANISWDEPNIFDNSQKVTIIKSREFGFFPIGTTQVNYTAIDPSNNTRICILNITVEDPHCEALPDPIYGNSNCATNKHGLNCVITCQEGYAIPLAAPSDVVNIDANSSTSFICNHSDPVWYNQEGLTFPECSVTAVPNEVEQEGVIHIQPKTDYDICNDTSALNELDNEIKTSLEAALGSSCSDNACDVSANTKCDIEEEADEEETNIIKRATRDTEVLPKKRNKKKKKLSVKFHLRTDKDIQAMLNNSVIQSNIEKHFKNMVNVKNTTVSFDIPKYKCQLGFVLKKNKCVQCPKGTYHSLISNKCQSCPMGYYNEDVGKTVCKTCPLHHSTRKLHSKSRSECKEECPPGTKARMKVIKARRHSNITMHRVTLKPHCRSCPLGTYQPEFGQTQCIKCSEGYTTSAVGSTNYLQCIPILKDPCTNSNSICNNGKCIPDNQGHYSCECEENYIGTHCEIKLDGCRSNPCLNNGICISNYDPVSTGYTCSCRSDFTGKFCEIPVERCNLRCENGGQCFEDENNQYLCLCPTGFYGDYCEKQIHFCQQNICENNGKCLEDRDRYSCSCPAGYIGRRCSLLPCDYRPCYGNSICVNLMLPNATKESYRCDCPQGYTGGNCTERIDYCLSNPCLNMGKCVSNETGYSCLCPKRFTGVNCEIERNTSYVLNFSNYDTNSYIKLKGFSHNLTEVTACLWMKTYDNFNYGTLFSYANFQYDNAFTLTDYSGLVLYVNNEYRITDIYLNDGLWHYVCASWKSDLGYYSVFVDGKLLQNNTGLSPHMEIQGYGNLIIGQDQDMMGGKFSELESFLGEMSHIDFWNSFLTPDEIVKNMDTCASDRYGDLYAWPEMKENIHGTIKIKESKFCKNCEMPKPVYNGFINVVDNIAYYECNVGFIISSSLYSNGRRCTKAASWEGTYEPYCQKVYCGYPGSIRNGYVTGRSYYYRDVVTYGCHEGYTLSSNSTRICREDGRWFPEKPVCQGVQCLAFKPPDYSEINIIAENSYEDFTENVYVDAGTQVEITCIKDANITGESLLTCQDDGTWDYPLPQCIKQKSSALACSVERIPQAPANSYVSSESLKAVENGTSNTVVYECRNGFKMQGDNTSICIIDGYWTEPNFTCKGALCPEPSKYRNMVVKRLNASENAYYLGDIATYECIDGFKKFGNLAVRCLSMGRWSKMLGSCTKKSCGKPTTIDGTTIEGTSYLFEDKVTLICGTNRYVLTCDKNGQWTGNRGSNC